MKRRAVIATTFIGLLAVAMVLLPLPTTRAQAATVVQFSGALQALGYVATPAGAVSYPGLTVAGTSLAVGRESALAGAADAKALVELFEYEDRAALQRDWLAVPDWPATPRSAAIDLNRRSVYWNGNGVLIVDFAPPNDAALAAVVGQAFLSQPAREVVASIASSRAAEETPTTLLPPRTGDAALLSADGPSLPIWVGVLWAGLSVTTLAFAAAGSVLVIKRAWSSPGGHL